MPPPFVGVEVKETVCPEQIVVDVEGVIITLGVTDGLIVIVVFVEVAVVGTAQLELDDIIQCTDELLVKAGVVKKAPLPTKLPSINHSYEGLSPPLVGVGVNVTDCPEQIVVEGEGVIITLGVTDGLIVIVVIVEEAVVGTAQLELEVIIQYTVELLVNGGVT